MPSRCEHLEAIEPVGTVCASCPLIASAEPGESWRWCYADETYLRGG
ncbi:MAG: hypothetical protein R3244_10005 [Thermoanaerobaculia bacterium]|nr:hypothetical protein [Thermoanaerobaculia bacterium]